MSNLNEKENHDENNLKDSNVSTADNILTNNAISPREKNNISPITKYNLKRQRCLFTNFNISATPFVSTTQNNTLPSSPRNQEPPQRLINSPRTLLQQELVQYMPLQTNQQERNFSMLNRLRTSSPQNDVHNRFYHSVPVTRPNNIQFYPYAEDYPATTNPPCKVLYSTFYRNGNENGPIVLRNGIIQLVLRDDIRVDITLDKSIRVFNNRSQIVIALSNSGSVALIHPNGRVFQFGGSRVEIMAYDGMRNNNYVRFAKIWYKGISFTSENCALIYLVDSAGTRTTTDNFKDITVDIASDVFYQSTQYGPEHANSALAVLQNSNFWSNEDGTQIFDINGFRISQSPDGMVRITRALNKCLIRTSPGNGSATITTPFLHCTASLGQTSHLFVRRGERRIHFDGSIFVVRNAGHSAGFDEQNFLRVY